MKTEKLYIILGCFGRREDDFICCAGIENRILQVEERLYLYNDLMDYLDSCRLFDRPMFDYNSIRHFIFNLREKFDQPTRRLWSEKKFEIYQKFTIDHRHCGLYIKLSLVNPQYEEPPSEPKGILIPGSENSDNSDNSDKLHKLRIIRGRQ